MSDAGGRFEAIGVGNSLKGAVVLRRGLLGSSTIVHWCREILLEDAGDRGLAASDPGSNTLPSDSCLGFGGQRLLLPQQRTLFFGNYSMIFYAFMSFNDV